MSAKIIIWLVATFLIILASKSQARGQFENDKLLTLGKIWGFLKYHHPDITENDIDWDSVLVVTIPKVFASENKKEFGEILDDLVTTAGSVNKCSACPNLTNDTLEYQINFDWFFSNKLISRKLRERLIFIRENAISTPNKYVKVSSIGVPIFEENLYREMQFPSIEYRLLGLFRYWNIINYFYPYKKLIEGSWDSVLENFIPKMVNVHNAIEYNWKILELTSGINDGHNSVDSKIKPPDFKPPFVVRYVDGKTVVAETDSGTSVKIGDIILEKSSVETKYIRDSLARFFRASNHVSTQSKIDGFLLFSDTKETELRIKRKDSLFNKVVEYKPFSQRQRKVKYSSMENGPWKKINGNVGYVDVSQLEPAHVDSLFEVMKDCKALIFDVRKRPKMGLIAEVPKYINITKKPMAKVWLVNQNQPGTFYSPPLYEAGPNEKKENYFAGKVIILVDENTKSMSEFFVMALQTSDNAYTIGRQTAGADGNIAFIWFPGGISVRISSIGINYPNNDQTQKVGVKIDQRVSLSIEEIIKNKDFILNKAIEYAVSH